MVLAFKACAIQSRRPGASTPRDRYLHRNSAKQREQRTRSHVDTRTGIPEEVTAGVGLKGGVGVGAPGDKERNRAGGQGGEGSRDGDASPLCARAKRIGEGAVCIPGRLTREALWEVGWRGDVQEQPRRWPPLWLLPRWALVIPGQSADQ